MTLSLFFAHTHFCEVKVPVFLHVSESNSSFFWKEAPQSTFNGVCGEVGLSGAETWLCCDLLFN